MDKYQMVEEDKKKVLEFFEKCWKKFGETTPGLLLVPVRAIESETVLDYIRESYDDKLKIL